MTKFAQNLIVVNRQSESDKELGKLKNLFSACLIIPLIVETNLSDIILFSEAIEYDFPSPTNEFLDIPRQSRSKSVDHQIVPISMKDIQERPKCVKCGHHFNGYTSKED